MFFGKSIDDVCDKEIRTSVMCICELIIFSRGPCSFCCRLLHCGWGAVPCGHHICGGCYSNPMPKLQRKAEVSPEVGPALRTANSL